MYADKLENLKNYCHGEKTLEAVLTFLEKNDIASLECGRHEVGEGVFLNISEYEPYKAADKWEAHRKYADLQIVLCGNERMDWAPISDAVGGEGYNGENDYELFASCCETIGSVYAQKGVFAYFAPCDAHRPGIKWKSEHVKKAVFKIPV